MLGKDSKIISEDSNLFIISENLKLYGRDDGRAGVVKTHIYIYIYKTYANLLLQSFCNQRHMKM